MNNLIETYLAELKKEMHDLDAAVIRDALADAEEHLQLALANENEKNADVDEKEVLQKIIEQYGSPSETAAAYAEIERRTSRTLSYPGNKSQKSLLGRFFGIYSDPKAWGGMLFMLISFITGVVYFSWVVTGLSLSISLSLFIFGLPLMLFFLISIRGITLLEGRLVEALLGIRMPRRPIFSSKEGKWYQRIPPLMKDKRTWLGMLYLVLQFILGTVYFCVLVTLLALALTGFAIPVAQLVFNLPIVYLGDVVYSLPTAALPFTVLGGFLILTLTMHFTRWVGQLHGRYAKSLLVGE